MSLSLFHVNEFISMDLFYFSKIELQIVSMNQKKSIFSDPWAAEHKLRPHSGALAAKDVEESMPHFHKRIFFSNFTKPQTMGIYIYVCMYVGRYVCMYVCTYVRMYVCTYVYIHIYIYTHIKSLLYWDLCSSIFWEVL